MRRRTFLGLLGALAAAPAARHAAAAGPIDRLTWWDPAPTRTQLGEFVALEWRYLAGRVATGGADFGFVVSLADYNPNEPFISTDRQELLVMREDLTGAQAHATATYAGTLSYSAATATYSFVADASPTITASWRLDTAAQRYTLSVASPALTLSGLQIAPVGALIPEGGTGVVKSGSLTIPGIPAPFEALSDYYADWATLSLGGSPVGVGRLDMQTIRPALGGAGGTGFSHHWFALAATLQDATRAWVSGWQIVTGATTAWGVTVARGAGAGWSVASVGSDRGFSGAEPLGVDILAYQAVPGQSQPARTGRRWRLRAGQAAASDLIDLDIAVAPGQFIQGARVSAATNIPMQESVGAAARGLIGGAAIATAQLAIVESTFSEPGVAAAPGQRVSLPLLRR